MNSLKLPVFGLMENVENNFIFSEPENSTAVMKTIEDQDYYKPGTTPCGLAWKMGHGRSGSILDKMPERVLKI